MLVGPTWLYLTIEKDDDDKLAKLNVVKQIVYGRYNPSYTWSSSYTYVLSINSQIPNQLW